ncbi:hypothetical protein [Bdellovibrio sp. HCB337]|uniref:hypothetical protein n=1 Tax=Bdellovibrio sp. HCB337 TaxID=3394358 RepID=UPI0039A54A0B
MMTKVNWQEKFKASIKNAENLHSKDSSNISLLLFCLRSKMVPVKEYLDWAKESYQLPVLSEKYFQIHQPKKEFFKVWQKIYNWSVECMPIAEWDGALIIACLEVPANYQNTNPTIFVLTSPEVLEKTWAIYQKSEKAQVANVNGSDFADMSSLAASVASDEVKSDNFFGADGELVLQDSGSEESEEGSEEISEESSSEEDSAPLDLSGEEDAGGSPDGLFLGDSNSPSPLAGLAKVSLAPQSEDVAIVVEDSGEIVLPPAPEEVPVAAAPAAAPRKGPRTSAPILNMELEGLGDKTKIDDLEEIEDHEVPMQNKKTISPLGQAPAGDFPQAPIKPTTSPAGAAAYLLEKLRKQGQGTFDKETIASFQRLRTFFKKSMLLAIGDKDRVIKPIVWDENFEGLTPQTAEFNLKTPSIFKIVTGTQKPYHGFVTVNDLNESFFESWNHGQIPDHVTLVPLMDGDLVVGMLMGFGEKSSYNKNVLQFTEGVAKDLSQRILKSSAPKAAA